MRAMMLTLENNKTIFINPNNFVSVYVAHQGKTAVDTVKDEFFVLETHGDVAQEFTAAMAHK